MRHSSPIACDLTVTAERDRWRYQCSRGCTPLYRDTKKNIVRACANTRLEPCVHLGAPTGQVAQCSGCPGQRQQHALMACAVHGQCLPIAVIDGHQSCQRCGEYEGEGEAEM